MKLACAVFTGAGLWLSAVAAGAPATLPPAHPPYYRVCYAPSQTPGELVYGVSYTLWLPPGVKTLRGVIIHQHGCGEGACRAGQTAAFDLHWQALARKHACALLGPSYEQPEKADCSLWCDPRHGSGARFLQALAALAAQSGHPELATVPWALWGHSGGGTWAGTMWLQHPERCAAVWLRSGTPRLVPREGSTLPPLTIPAAALAVPVMCNLGTKEGVTVTTGRFARVWQSMEALFKDARGRGGLIGVAVDPNSSHDCGNQRYLAIPWFDACLAARLPEQAGAANLQPMPAATAWLAPLRGPLAQSAAQFQGDLATSVWLPDERVAKAWAEYSKDGNVSDATPPPPPTNVRLTGRELTWDAEADFESGLAGFVIERDGAVLARLPAKPAGVIGRPLFQQNSYSDTPTPPLAALRYTDTNALAGSHRYAVRTINSVGLPSPPAPATEEVPSYLKGYEELYRKNPRQAAVQWFKAAKFGLFIHYGLYSLTGRGEWVQFHDRMPVADYAKLKDKFTAAKFDAPAIAALAQEAGMKYITLVCKHCDSFCLWDTKVTGFNSVNSPAKRDLVAELAAACRARGLGFFVFYEHGFDWRHPHGPAPWDWKNKSVRPAYDPPDPFYAPRERYDFNHYLAYVTAGVSELCSQYGPLAGVWLDGIAVPLSGERSRFRVPELYARIRQLQPQALICYKSGLHPELEDFMAPEQPQVAAAMQNRGGKPMEICRTMQKRSPTTGKLALWGWLEGAEHVTADEVMAMLAEAGARDANLLLNVGPLPDGSLHPADVATLKEVGRRLRK